MEWSFLTDIHFQVLMWLSFMVRTVVVKVSVYKDTIGCYNSLRHAQGSLGASGANVLLYRPGQYWYRLSVSVVHINSSNCALDTLIGLSSGVPVNCSWRACAVSLCPSGCFMRIHFPTVYHQRTLCSAGSLVKKLWLELFILISFTVL